MLYPVHLIIHKIFQNTWIFLYNTLFKIISGEKKKNNNKKRMLINSLLVQMLLANLLLYKGNDCAARITQHLWEMPFWNFLLWFATETHVPKYLLECMLPAGVKCNKFCLNNVARWFPDSMPVPSCQHPKLYVLLKEKLQFEIIWENHTSHFLGQNSS